MILVVGAGIAGLAAAISLSRYGEVVVAERRSAVAANAGAGIQLAPNAVKALRFIGAADAVDAVADTPDGLEVWSAGRRRPTTFAPYVDFPHLFGAPTLTASRAGLHGALLSLAASNPSVSILYDQPVGRVEGVAGGWEVADVGTFSFVVAADGVNSAVRARVEGDHAQAIAQVAWRGSSGGDLPSSTRLSLSAGTHLVRYKLSDQTDNVVLVTPERLPHPSALSSRRIGALIKDVSGWSPWPIRIFRRHRYGRGTLAYCGDAAHAMPPFLAQGGAMALEDASVLAAAVEREGLSPAAVDLYRAARLPRTKRLAAQTDRQGTIYHLPAPFSLARDMAMARLGPNAILRQVGWIYGWSPPGP
ncbi:MAG: FAD-dependent monooxygenase [Pseudomonadota bacterium]